MFVVLFGNVIDGITIHGPFVTAQDANDYAEGGDVWWVVDLKNPLKYEQDAEGSVHKLLQEVAELQDAAATMLGDVQTEPTTESEELTDDLAAWASDCREAIKDMEEEATEQRASMEEVAESAIENLEVLKTVHVQANGLVGEEGLFVQFGPGSKRVSVDEFKELIASLGIETEFAGVKITFGNQAQVNQVREYFELVLSSYLNERK